MFGSRRLAKRSIVGTRVAAKWQDGRYYPGVIQSQYAEETPFTDAVYSVLFDDGYEKNIPSKSIIGQGFQQINSAFLKNGQNVFLTLNGREVMGTVVQHNVERDEIQTFVLTPSGDEIELTKRLEEIRLMKSRKSARLLDQDTDYSKLADLQLSESKKRAVSSGIDMPNKQRPTRSNTCGFCLCQHEKKVEFKPSRKRERKAGRKTHKRSRHWHSENVVQSNDFHVNHITRGDESIVTGDVEMMDENIAAMVLTSLSCSPQSPQFGDLREIPAFSKPNQLSSSTSSSGFYSNNSERSDPSPPSSSHLSESAPVSSNLVFGPFPHPQDEGVQFDVDMKEPEENEEKKVQMKTMYKCTWPGCQKICVSCSTIEKHVRQSHLGPQEDSGSEEDGEEEFYYTEIEVNVENVTQGLSDMSTEATSPPTDVSPTIPKQPFVIPDHDYQKKDFRKVFASSVPSNGAFNTPTQAVPIPIKVPEVHRSLSWQNTYTFSSSPSPPIRATGKLSSQERLHQHQAQSPKIHSNAAPKLMSIHKKPRSEVRKCRKVYGMENREMWCTQCKWKKACTRFLD